MGGARIAAFVSKRIVDPPLPARRTRNAPIAFENHQMRSFPNFVIGRSGARARVFNQCELFFENAHTAKAAPSRGLSLGRMRQRKWGGQAMRWWRVRGGRK